MSHAVYWFTHDLRVEDNKGFAQAMASESALMCVYCLSPEVLTPKRYHQSKMGKARLLFLLQSLQELDDELKKMGQHLHVIIARPESLMTSLHANYDIRRIYHSMQAGWNEAKQFKRFSSLPSAYLYEFSNHTLFKASDLPFEIAQLPPSFSQFRRAIEKNEILISPPSTAPRSGAAPLVNQQENWFEHLCQRFDLPLTLEQKDINQYGFKGGCISGLTHLEDYFDSIAPQTYKATRNALDGWSSSSKLSPWLAVGGISPRQVIRGLQSHEAYWGKNDSTYWIFFELLWREYFQWYAIKHGSKLFAFEGITEQKPLNSFYPERFTRWCQGDTPYPIVNACMKQLNETGFMSNRGRQIVASCFVHELQLDWRYGAAYFEQHLLDYDVAANWGNWQYLAGVGADPRGWRRFDLAKQTALYDPDGKFIATWASLPPTSQAIDSVDLVDWPVG